MAGRVLRLGCAAVVATVAVLGPAGGVRAAPEPPVAPVTPAPSAPEPSAPEPSVTPSPTAPGRADATEPPRGDGESVAELLVELRKLYRAAEQATARYKATAEQLKKQTAETRRATGELARARLALTDSRLAAGRLARRQYQEASGFDGYVRLLLSPDPRAALDQKHVIVRLARERVTAVDRLASAERRADRLATAARRALDMRQVLTERQEKQRDAARKKLRAVERLLASLTPEQLAALPPTSPLPETGGVAPGPQGAQGGRAAPGASPPGPPIALNALGLKRRPG